jgi:hypothetical protein
MLKETPISTLNGGILDSPLPVAPSNSSSFDYDLLENDGVSIIKTNDQAR